jgi:hypothetical protein
MVRRCFLACAVVLLSLWTAPAFTQAGRCSNTTPPAPVATLGYNTRIFCDDWPDLTSIDVNNTCQTQTTPGDCINSSTGKPYKWFPFEGWPSIGRCAGAVDSYVGCQSTITASATDIALHSGGGLDLTAHAPSIITNANGVNFPVGAALVSCRDDGHNNEYMGFVAPAASYVRWNVYNVPDPTPGDALQPALWAEPTEMLAASASTGPPIPNPWNELDWVETGFSTGVAHLHEWNPNDGEDIPQSQWGYWSSMTNFTLASLLIPTSLGTTAVYTALGLSLSNGTGSLYGYINDAIPPTGSNSPSAPLTWTAGGRWSEVENMHFCIIIWAAQTTVSVGSIEVWAATPLSRSATGAGLWKFLHRR